MPRTSYGPKKRAQAWQLVAALMQRQGTQGVQIDSTDSHEYILQINASLFEMGKWAGLGSEEVREALTKHLGEKFLKIMVDQREQKAGQGAEIWRFQLKLWSTDLDENRQLFDRAWQNAKSSGSIDSSPSIPLPLDKGTCSEGLGYDRSTPRQFDEALVQETREHCRKEILRHHSRIQLLGGEEIGLELYVEVLLWEKPESKSFNLSLERRIKRNPGLDIANEISKLVILGKPGSGKTTFLKHLAVNWCNEEFQEDLIAVLIELREIQDDQWHLLSAVDQQLGLFNWPNMSSLSTQILGLNAKIPGLKAQIPELSTQISELSLQISKLNSEIPKFRAKILNFNTQIRTLKSQEAQKRHQADKMQNQMVALEQQLKDSEQKLEELTPFLSRGKDIAELKTFIEGLEAEISTLKLQGAQERHEADETQNQTVELEQQLGKSEQQLGELEQQLKRSKRLLKESEQQLKESEEKLESFPLQCFLKQGKLLILMDGFDEVSTHELRCKLQSQISEVSAKYFENRFILTCRTQVMESVSEGFTCVEMADFDQGQVRQFSQNWFKEKEQREKFEDAVDSKPALKELTATPVLLSLMCLVFQDSGGVPSNKIELYRSGVESLLSQWNEEKRIHDWQVGSKIYRKLDISKKEALLMEIAARKFEDQKNFVVFQQRELANQIANQITQLLKLDKLVDCKQGVEVLKAIETHHGLLIERANRVWSFSHLTFQEYFTAQWLNQLSSEEFAEKIVNQRWQEILLQLVTSQQPADDLLQRIQQEINRSIENEPTLQALLSWLSQKSNSTQAQYKPAAIRAFYYLFFLKLDLDPATARADVYAYANALDLRLIRHDLDRNLDLDLVRQLDLARKLDLPHAENFNLVRGLDSNLARDLDSSLGSDLELDLALYCALYCAFALSFDTIDFTLNHFLGLILEVEFDKAFFFSDDDYLKSRLQKLREELPASNKSERIHQWWKENGLRWAKQLRKMIIEHRNIGHDWQFTDEQKQQLENYYDLNKFLVNLMNTEGAVSDDVRTEIEDTLLISWQELKRLQPAFYRDLQ